MKLINSDSSMETGLTDINKIRYYWGTTSDNESIINYFSSNDTSNNNFSIDEFKERAESDNRFNDFILNLNSVNQSYSSPQSLNEFNMMIHKRYLGKVMTFNETRVGDITNNGYIYSNEAIPFYPVSVVRNSDNSAIKIFVPGYRDINSSARLYLITLIELYKDDKLIITLCNNSIKEWKDKFETIPLSNGYSDALIYETYSINEYELDRVVTICDADLESEVNTEVSSHKSKDNQHASQIIYAPTDIVSQNLVNSLVFEYLMKVNKINFNSGLVIDENFNIIYFGALTG